MLLPIIAFMAACSEEEVPSISKNELYPFFYPYDTIPKIYVYRDQSNGISEKFHRVYGIEDSQGKHIVVEYYSEDGRIIEAYNYMVDSLRLVDHMVVNRDGVKTQAWLIKNAHFPFTKKEVAWFASKAPGFLDSTLILSELIRGVERKYPFPTRVLGKNKPTILLTDTVRTTILNPYTRSEKESVQIYKSYFTKGVGLTRMRDQRRRVDFALEKILSQDEWVKIMSR